MSKETDPMKKIQMKQKNASRILQSEWILEGEREVWIVHGDQHYRLQVTRAGKLILTK